jgi:beta-lactamase regulating signal transducer with metallopeptidase domain
MSGILENLNQASSAAIAAVINSLWQAVAVAAAAWVAMRFTPRMNAATRHALWWAVLAAILVLPLTPAILARWHALSQPATGQETPAIPVAGLGPSPVTMEADRNTGTTAVGVPQRDAIFGVPSGGPASGVPTRGKTARATAPLELRAGVWPTWIAAVWSIVLLLQLGRIAWSYAYLRQVKRRALRPAPELRRNFDAWMMSCGVHRPARLLVSSEIVSPMAVGFRQPAVVLPAPLLEQFQEPELDHVLLHELAHIARQDDWWNLFARLASAVLALHPVAAWVLRHIEREREIACDDWVVSMTGAARPYAASLARLFELCFVRRRMVLASGMAGRASHLGERIQMLLHRSREYTPKASMARVALSTAILLAIAIAGAQAPRWLAFAQEAPPAVALPPALALEPDQTPPAAPASPFAPRAAEAPQPAMPAIAPGPDPMFAAPGMPRPAVASTPTPFATLAPAALQDVQVELVRLDALRSELATLTKSYGPQHPNVVTIEHQIAMLQDAVRAASAPTPQPGPATPHASFLAALVAAGYGNLSVDDIINLKNAGVSAQFLTGMNQSGWGKLSPQELIDLCHRGVNPEYVRKIKEAGIRDVTLQDVMDLSSHGVRPETIQEIHALGFGPYTAKQTIQMAQFGMRTDLFRALKDAGLGNATPAEIMDAQMAGLGPRDLREARQYGPNLTLKQIIKLKMAGVI